MTAENDTQTHNSLWRGDLRVYGNHSNRTHKTVNCNKVIPTTPQSAITTTDITRIYGRSQVRVAVRPRPHQQQCRSNVRHCRKNRSTCSVRQCCFDIVASMDGAVRSLTTHAATTLVQAFIYCLPSGLL